MCVSMCFRRLQFYDNHEDCKPIDCPFAQQSYPTCKRCCHVQGNLCTLTGHPHPENGCCHFNIVPVRHHSVTLDTLKLIEPDLSQPIPLILDQHEIDYEIGETNGQPTYLIDTEHLAAKPFIYGLGTEPTVKREATRVDVKPIDFVWEETNIEPLS